MELTQWKGGGIAGEAYSVRLGAFEVGSLPKPKAGEFAALIDDCKFFELPERLPPEGAQQTDPLEYRLLVTDDARVHQVDWNDNSAVPDQLRHLAELLSELPGWTDVPWESWHDRRG
jgi:hypothetical protein